MALTHPDRERVRVYCIKAAAHKLGVCRRTIERLIQREQLKAVQITGRRRGIPADEIERVAAHGIAAR